MPFTMAPMPCSRTPKRTLRSAGVSAWKSPNIFISVMLDGARSALPPIRPGSTGASAFRHVCEWMRVATPFTSGVYVGSAFSHPAGSLRLSSPSSSAASFGYLPLYAAKPVVHAASAAAPSGTSSPKCVFTSAGTSNGAYGHFRFARVASTSALPSGAPCTSWLSALLGEP